MFGRRARRRARALFALVRVFALVSVLTRDRRHVPGIPGNRGTDRPSTTFPRPAAAHATRSTELATRHGVPGRPAPAPVPRWESARSGSKTNADAACTAGRGRRVVITVERPLGHYLLGRSIVSPVSALSSAQPSPTGLDRPVLANECTASRIAVCTGDPGFERGAPLLGEPLLAVHPP